MADSLSAGKANQQRRRRNVKKIALLTIVGALALLLTDSARAQCSKSAGAKLSLESCKGPEKPGCPIEAALAKVELTDAQEKQIAAASKGCQASLDKAAGISCPTACGKAKMDAVHAYIKKVKAVLTAEQVKQFEAALPVKKHGTAAGCGGCK